MFKVCILFFSIMLFCGVVVGQDCVQCHQKITPGIVGDWQISKHSQNGIECSACHGDLHTSAADVDKALIPTPQTCETCHETQVKQFSAGKHAMAWASYLAMPTTHELPMELREGMKGCGGCHKVGLKSEEQMRFRYRVVRRLSHPACLFGRGGAPAASLSDMPHGVRSSPMGDVFLFETRRPRSFETNRHYSRIGRRPDLPDMPHAGGKP